MNILVTGGLGFIGSHLVKRLVAEGNAVHVLGIGPLHNVSDVRDKIILHKVDLRKYEHVKKSLIKINPSKIFHLAAHVNVSRTLNYDRMLENNFNGTVNLLKAAENIDYDCFINTGTCEEYGNGTAPFRESQKPHPVSPYSESKVKTTEYCIDYQRKTGRPVSVLRPFLTYGPFQKNSFLIPYVITSALLKKPILTTKGEQQREFNYVSDIVDGFIVSSNSRKAIGKIINLGSGKEYKIRDVIRKILGLMRSDVKVDNSLPYRNGEVMHFYCSNAKAKRILGWKPKVSLEAGLEETICWYKEKFKSGDIKKWMV